MIVVLASFLFIIFLIYAIWDRTTWEDRQKREMFEKIPQNDSPLRSENYAKALEFLKVTVGEKTYNTLLKGKMVSIKASNGIIYGVDLKGNIAKKTNSALFEEEVKYGELSSDTIPIPDLVATFIVWAKTNPKMLENRWKCGDITINDRTRRSEIINEKQVNTKIVEKRNRGTRNVATHPYILGITLCILWLILPPIIGYQITYDAAMLNMKQDNYNLPFEETITIPLGETKTSTRYPFFEKTRGTTITLSYAGLTNSKPRLLHNGIELSVEQSFIIKDVFVEIIEVAPQKIELQITHPPLKINQLQEANQQSLAIASTAFVITTLCGGLPSMIISEIVNAMRSNKK